MSIPKAKKQKQKHSPEWRAGREAGVADTLVIFFALAMQDKGWSLAEVEKFGKRVLEVDKYTKEPNLPFYISTVEKILAEQGVHITRET